MSTSPTGSGRSRRKPPATAPTVVQERGEAADAIPGEAVPGTSLVMHRFPRGSLAGQPWIGADGVPVGLVNEGVREIALAINSWKEDQQLNGQGQGSTMFDRNAYVPPDNIFEQMQMARRAVRNDDVVGGLADATEALSLRKSRWESTSLEDADIFNQWAAEVDLDNFIRVAWRELFTYSQYVAARWWGFRDYKVRGYGPPKMNKIEGTPNPDGTPGTPRWEPERDEETGLIKKGQKRKKEYKGVYVPVGLTVLDSTRVVPMGSLLFGQETLVWTANKAEMNVWNKIAEGKISRQVDPIISNFFTGVYAPSEDERQMLIKLGVRNTTDLLVMNPAFTWRHTLTRPHYEPWADLRLKRAFRYLDMKQQLLASDRVSLVGNANYILLVRKGEKDAPATQEELDNLNENFAFVARLPVIIGDHTLQIDIISPKQEFTLKGERYDVLDTHIRDTVLTALSGEAGGSDRARSDALKARTIALGLTNRRHGIKRDFEAKLARAIVEHPFNEDKFEGEPNLVFSPRNITLERDEQGLQALIAISARGDVSRQTTLEEALDLDQETEAQRREQEQLWFDPIFKTATPFNGNSDPQNGNANPAAGGPGNQGGTQNGPPGAGGGGRPPGGGAPKATPASPTVPKKRAPRGTNR